MTTFSFPAISQNNGLTKYLQDIRSFPNLSIDEEYNLAKSWITYEDIDAAHKLVLSHLKLVPKIASSFKGYGLPLMDLISEGNIGLMQSLKNFDPDMGNRFSTYAMWWIKAAMQDYILKSWSLVKITSTHAHRKLFFGLRKLKNKIYATSGNNLSDYQMTNISNEMDVTLNDVKEMNERMTLLDCSLNKPLTHDGESTGELLDTIAEKRPNQEAMIIQTDLKQRQMKMFRDVFDKLSDREKYIITERRLKEEPTRLEDLSKIYNVSLERIRQIEERAIEKIKKELEGVQW